MSAQVQGKKKSSLSSHKKLAVAALLLFIGLCILPLCGVSFSEDISTMIPQGKNGRIAEDFRLLQKAPLSGNILISISSDTVGANKLISIADTFSEQLDENLLSLQNYQNASPQKVIKFLLDKKPLLTTDNDLQKLKSITSPASIEATMAESKRLLLSPSGFGLKNIIASDPLNLRSIYLKKLATLQNMPRLDFADEYFISRDNTAVLLIARTEIPMTDSNKGALLTEHLNSIKKQIFRKYGSKTPDLNISILGGHIYTVANSSIIKRDILTISAISAAALLLLFILAFRRRTALAVFAAPAVAIFAGLGGASFFFPHLSAIVIGFGAVLMGISIDFAIHIWFSLAENPKDKKAALHKVARPLLYGAATSCTAFAALYISGIPGIKQLAVFSVTGIIAACAYALLFLPCFCDSFPRLTIKSRSSESTKINRATLLIFSSLIMLAGLSAAFSNSFDTELKHLGYVSDEIISSENSFRQKWGDLRGQSLLFAQGKDNQEALRNNERIQDDMKNNMPGIKAVSIAPVMPSKETQKSNKSRWESFWSAKRLSDTISTVENAADRHGFTPQLFKNSIKDLSVGEPFFSIKDLHSSPLGFMVDLFVPEKDEGKSLILTLLPDNDKVNEYYSRHKEQELGARLISQSKFKTALENEMQADILRFICFSGLLVLLLVIVLFRNPRRSFLALLPAVFGVIATFGLLGALSVPLNIFHIVALPLVIGLGADYGIFIVFQEIKRPSPATLRAVKISGLTTLSGFGVLVFAKHPSLHSLGATVATGVTATLICAVFILPHFLRLGRN